MAKELILSLFLSLSFSLILLPILSFCHSDLTPNPTFTLDFRHLPRMSGTLHAPRGTQAIIPYTSPEQVTDCFMKAIFLMKTFVFTILHGKQDGKS